MHFDPARITDHDRSNFEQLGSDRAALFSHPVGAFQAKATQAVHEYISEGAHDQAVLIGPPPMTGGSISEEIELLFFDPVFHIATRTVDFVIEGSGVSAKVGDEVTRVASFGGVLGFANHEPWPIPRSSLVVKPGKETLFFAGALEGDPGLFQGGLKEFGDALVSGKSDQVVDVVALAPTKHAPTAKAGVGPKGYFDLGPGLAKSFDKDFEDGPSSARAVGIGRSKQGAERVTPAKNVERKEAVAAIVMVVGGAFLTSVNEVVGGVEVEDEFAWWGGVTFDKEVDEQMGQAHRTVSIGPLLHATKSGSTCQG